MRALVKTHFISVAEKLLQRNNYGSFMGVLTGLNMVSTSRLKNTDRNVAPAYMAVCFPPVLSSSSHLPLLTLQKLEKLGLLQDPTSSFGTLRAKMKESGSRVLPYVYVFLPHRVTIPAARV
jgi:hypothetical protein